MSQSFEARVREAWTPDDVTHDAARMAFCAFCSAGLPASVFDALKVAVNAAYLSGAPRIAAAITATLNEALGEEVDVPARRKDGSIELVRFGDHSRFVCAALEALKGEAP